ncbi:MAG: NMT1/THI5 like domain-containing protein [Parcubacteria group bacterium Gr01-1014_48]|nr:MAG: NMT1/THI5 like domain-containing protein [Parcubacteria group bacterium Greene0416_14]TSC73765.1 MAG: NMT1/THI5 like domain-containing protein [Parcubacteria group bacterium Gr01-1014_48]TSD01193.1 MAG: NMT1/THI5 like domain-containing protein [Parcubacteria group bacterium Greene1014_15]TSD08198.1 MAG: NMT1/THI5 like domain-containing protein [Parcubacteria group bacterium Greene0714_4]
MNKKIFVTIGIVILVVGGILWLQRLSDQEGGIVPIEKVRISLKWLHQAQFAGLYVAKEKGFYEDKGLDVEIKEWDFSVSQETDLAERKEDFAMMNPIEVLKAVDKGLDFRAVAIIYQDASWALVALKESGITTPADFRGKVLGLKGNTDDGRIIYPALLKTFGIDEGEVMIKPIGFETGPEVQDVVEKRADVINVYRTDQVYLFDKQGLEYNLILPERFGFEMNGDVLVTTQRLIDENPDLVQGFVEATIKGWQYAMAHSEEAVDLTMPYVTNETYKDQELEKFIFEKSIPLIQPLGPEKIGSIQFIRWRTLYEAMRSNGLLEHEFDVDRVFTRKFLD